MWGRQGFKCEKFMMLFEGLMRMMLTVVIALSVLSCANGFMYNSEILHDGAGSTKCNRTYNWERDYYKYLDAVVNETLIYETFFEDLLTRHAQMMDDSGGKRRILTDDKVKEISDWSEYIVRVRRVAQDLASIKIPDTNDCLCTHFIDTNKSSRMNVVCYNYTK